MQYEPIKLSNGRIVNTVPREGNVSDTVTEDGLDLSDAEWLEYADKLQAHNRSKLQKPKKTWDQIKRERHG